MNCKDLYERVYALFDKVTPLDDVDCGLACDAACCKGDKDEGMYLYPGEMAMYDGKEKWISVEKSEFYIDDVPVPIAICDGKCDRKKRPLACRIFPLMFYAKRGDKTIKIQMDPRARAMCPLARVLTVEDLSEQFVLNVSEAADMLSEYKEIMEFIYEQSEMIDELPDLGKFDIQDIIDEFNWNDFEENGEYEDDSETDSSAEEE